MSELLLNHLGGQWIAGQGSPATLLDPVLGTELVQVNASGLDLQAGFRFAREEGGKALRGLTYAQRGGLLAAAVKVLQANRDAYYEISTANSGTVKNDTAVDVDGAIYTLGVYAKLGESLGDRHFLLDGDAARLGKDPLFQSQHIFSPTRGLALFINAFNFPAWGLWEKAGPALLSGVPVIIKPATATAWLTQRMVRDVVDAGIFPAGSLSVICGSPQGLLDALQPMDVLSFTGSADTAATLRAHEAVTRRSVRVNIEADSVNSAMLMPGEATGSAAFDLLVKEVVREMTVKSGQKCTAIRRIFVPENIYADVGEAISAKLAKTTVGNPRNETVRMGALVSRSQFNTVREGIAQLAAHAQILHDGRQVSLVDADPAIACCIGPTLLGSENTTQSLLHDTEVFGPAATLMPYRDLQQGQDLVRRGEGSLVMSLYGSDSKELAASARALADHHGRVHIISPDVAQSHSGHGNVMPQSLHGGPGRAGGGEELGGSRALNFYHRRSAIQASSAVLQELT